MRTRLCSLIICRLRVTPHCSINIVPVDLFQLFSVIARSKSLSCTSKLMMRDKHSIHYVDFQIETIEEEKLHTWTEISLQKLCITCGCINWVLVSYLLWIYLIARITLIKSVVCGNRSSEYYSTLSLLRSFNRLCLNISHQTITLIYIHLDRISINKHTRSIGIKTCVIFVAQESFRLKRSGVI